MKKSKLQKLLLSDFNKLLKEEKKSNAKRKRPNQKKTIKPKTKSQKISRASKNSGKSISVKNTHKDYFRKRKTNDKITEEIGQYYSQKDEEFYTVVQYSRKTRIEIDKLDASNFESVFEKAMNNKKRRFIALGCKLSYKIGSQYFNAIFSIPLEDAPEANLDYLFIKLSNTLDRAGETGKSGIFSETIPKVVLLWATIYEV